MLFPSSELHRMRSEELSCDHPSASGPSQALGWLRHVETNCRGRGRKGHEAEIIPVILTTPKMVPNMCESLTKP
jgi:hypothetical protein